MCTENEPPSSCEAALEEVGDSTAVRWNLAIDDRTRAALEESSDTWSVESYFEQNTW